MRRHKRLEERHGGVDASAAGWNWVPPSTEEEEEAGGVGFD